VDENIVNIENGSLNYRLGNTMIPALRGINISIQRGEFSIIAGPSGSGKTSLLNCIGLIDTLSAGLLEICGKDMSALSCSLLTKLRRNEIGIIFQSFNLIPVLDAFENVEYPLLLTKFSRKQRKEIVYRYLEKVGLYERRHHKPKELSVGEMQRVAVARALVKNPSIILADEPTANLDSRNSVAIIELMRALHEEDGSAYIISSHDPLVVERADRLVHIRDGMITAMSS